MFGLGGSSRERRLHRADRQPGQVVVCGVLLGLG